MGQYYKPVNLSNNEFLESWSYDNGSKLMEHSWLGNNFVATVESLLSKNRSWYKSPIVWAGDYADEDVEIISENGSVEVVNIYHSLDEVDSINPRGSKGGNKKLRYIVNHSKREFVDKTKVPSCEQGYRVHPLPILTCEGNNRGGGDLRPDRCTGNTDLIGYWSRDIISVETAKPKGYKEIDFDIVEHY